MTYQTVSLEEFGGLDLAPFSERFGLKGARVCSNVDVSQPGRVQCRPGSLSLMTLTGYDATLLGQSNGDTIVQWQGAAPKVRTYNASGTMISSVSTATGGFAEFQLTGDTLLCFGEPGFGLRYWSTTVNTFTTSAISPDAAHPGAWLACATVDSRLAVARNSTYPYRVWFSNPGLPSTFTSTNWVDLDPGDGEPIVALVRWRDLMFAFKRTKFYVFYGTSTDNTGGPVFNYRTVDVGIGATGTYDLATYSATTAVAAARDGVYFQADDGMYVTTGDKPQKISGPLDPWFRGQSLTGPALAAGDFTDCSVAADSRFVYFRPASTAATISQTFAYSLDTRQWSLFNVRLLAALPFEASKSKNQSLFGTSAAVKVLDTLYTTDDGAAIDWEYVTGVSDLGTPAIKTVRQARVWGVGEPTLSVYTNYSLTDAGASAVTLGTTDPEDDLQLYSRAGQFFSVGLEGTGSDTVNRVGLDVRETRVAGIA